MITLNLILGIVGMAFILVAFILDEFVKKFNQDTVQYNVLNIVGSGILSYYAFISSVWPFLILNVIWFLTASYKLIRILRK